MSANLIDLVDLFLKLKNRGDVLPSRHSDGKSIPVLVINNVIDRTLISLIYKGNWRVHRFCTRSALMAHLNQDTDYCGVMPHICTWDGTPESLKHMRASDVRAAATTLMNDGGPIIPELLLMQDSERHSQSGLVEISPNDQNIEIWIAKPDFDDDTEQSIVNAKRVYPCRGHNGRISYHGEIGDRAALQAKVLRAQSARTAHIIELDQNEDERLPTPILAACFGKKLPSLRPRTHVSGFHDAKGNRAACQIDADGTVTTLSLSNRVAGTAWATDPDQSIQQCLSWAIEFREYTGNVGHLIASEAFLKMTQSERDKVILRLLPRIAPSKQTGQFNAPSVGQIDRQAEHLLGKLFETAVKADSDFMGCAVRVSAKRPENDYLGRTNFRPWQFSTEPVKSSRINRSYHRIAMLLNLVATKSRSWTKYPSQPLSLHADGATSIHEVLVASEELRKLWRELRTEIPEDWFAISPSQRPLWTSIIAELDLGLSDIEAEQASRH